jgi:hypothetical protein
MGSCQSARDESALTPSQHLVAAPAAYPFAALARQADRIRRIGVLGNTSESTVAAWSVSMT